VRIFYGLTPDLPIVAVVGLGPNNAGYNELEELDEKAENLRIAISSGVRALHDLGSVDEIDVEVCDNPTGNTLSLNVYDIYIFVSILAAAEGASLGLYYFDELKSASLKKSQMKLNVLANESSDEKKWNLGLILANGQNLCRSLKETPANLMTPTIFANIAKEKLSKV